MAKKHKHRFSVDDVNLAGASFHDVNLAQSRFVDVDLTGAVFDDVSLAGAVFDDISFAGASIGADCDFTGMTIAGVKVSALLALHARATPKKKKR